MQRNGIWKPHLHERTHHDVFERLFGWSSSTGGKRRYSNDYFAINIRFDAWDPFIMAIRRVVQCRAAHADRNKAYQHA